MADNIKPYIIGEETSGALGDWNLFHNIKNKYAELKISKIYERNNIQDIWVTIANCTADGSNNIILKSDLLSNLSFPVIIDLTQIEYDDIEILFTTDYPGKLRIYVEDAVFLPYGQQSNVNNSKPHPEYPDGVLGVLDNLLLFRVTMGGGMGEYVAQEFSDESSYAKDTYVLYDDEVYLSNNTIGTGGFDSSKWTRHYLVDDFLAACGRIRTAVNQLLN